MLRHISRIANEASAGESTWKSPVPAPSADDGAHRSFVIPLPLAYPGPGRLGQARGVPVGDQRLAAMGGVPQGVDPDGPAQSLHRVAQAIDGSPEVVQDGVDGRSDDRLEQVLLGAHVVVQARGADAQASGDLADGGAVIAALSEQRERGVEHGAGGDGGPGLGGCGIGMLQ